MPNSNINYLRELESAINPTLWSLLTNLSGLAEAHGIPLYLAGGSVRDMLLGTEPVDLDFVVEGDALALARALAKKFGGEVTTHSRFGTATYTKKGISLDLARARTEYYPRPGSLPVVKPGVILDDLYRRDFTINSIAIRISGPQSGKLLDPFYGRLGIKNKQIKVLHNQSFSDDPTRIIRAIRYEQRFGFRIDNDTYKLLQNNLQQLPTVGVDRLRKELNLLLSEEKPDAGIIRAFELGILQAIHPSLTAGRWLLKKFEAARSSRLEVDPSVYLSLLLYHVVASHIDQFLSHYRFRKSQIEVVNDTIKLKGFEAQLGDPRLKPSTALRLLKGISPKAIQAFSIASENEKAKIWAQEYMEKLRLINTELTGTDLINMDVPSGPAIGKMLDILLDARVDGLVRSRDDELRLVKNVISGHSSD